MSFTEANNVVHCCSAVKTSKIIDLHMSTPNDEDPELILVWRCVGRIVASICIWNSEEDLVLSVMIMALVLVEDEEGEWPRGLD